MTKVALSMLKAVFRMLKIEKYCFAGSGTKM